MPNFSYLSPAQFETFAADILSAVHGVYFERYGEGRDGGVDCKHVTNTNEVWIGQAKRYKNTANLLSKLPEEQVKMARQANPPARYFLVTSCSLTPANKESIKTTMHPFVLSTADIYGKDELISLLSDYQNIYHKHHQLWLHGVEQLNRYLQHANYNRITVEYQRLLEETKYYLHPAAEESIYQQLNDGNSCLIVGEPGIGKSITAGQIALQWQLNNRNSELIWLNDRNFEQALQLIRQDAEQIIVLDDFLGATFLDTSGILAFAKDWQALLFHAQQAQGKLKLIFTTRNYILEQALALIDVNYSLINDLCKNAVVIEHKNAWFRVELLQNLLYKSSFTKEQLQTFNEQQLYWPILKTKAFTPRLFTTLIEQLARLPANEFNLAVKQGITGQHQLWQNIFNHLSKPAQTLLYLMAIAGQYADSHVLKTAFYTLYQQLYAGIAPLNSFDQALIELEPTFIVTESHLNKIWCNPINPSVIDFLHLSINDNTPLINALIHSIESLPWGVNNFALNTENTKPIKLKCKQIDLLLDKLVELLNEPASQLMQITGKENEGWEERTLSFGNKLSRLWRVVMTDLVLAKQLYEKLEPLLPEPHNWQTLFIEVGMEEILNLSCYLPKEEQHSIWVQATRNTSNSEDAAAIASFYYNNKDAKKELEPQRKAIIKRLLDTCENEIYEVTDPDHLEAILHDLYTLKEYLNTDISNEKFMVYSKIEDLNNGLFDQFLDDNLPTYYNHPEPSSDHPNILSQLAKIKTKVEESFSNLVCF